MLRTGMLSVVACLLVSGVSFGQDFPKPGPEHKKLQEMVGTWEAVMDSNGQKSKGTVVYKSICEGMFVASDFDGEFFGQTFKGHGIDGYDQNKKEYVSVWVDSMTTTPMTIRGNYKGDELVMNGETPGPDGNMMKVRTVTTMADKDHMTFKFYMVEGGDQPVFTIEYSRKK